MYGNLGQRDQAEKYFQMALARIDRMTDREKYRTFGVYYVTIRNNQRAVQEFTSLVREYPADSAGHANMAVAYLFLRNLPKAIEESQRAVDIYPKNVPQGNNVALFRMYAGDFASAEREAHAVLALNPSLLKSYIAVALCELAQGDPAKAAEAYRSMAKLGPRGASFAAAGLADLQLYEGRTSEAIATLEGGVSSDLANKFAAPAASKLTTLAYAHLMAGQTTAANQAADRAVVLTRDEGVLLDASRVFLETGKEGKAHELAHELSERLETEVQVYAKLIEGAALAKRRPAEAIPILRGANQLVDTWLGHYELGRAFLEAGSFAEAYSEFELCWKRRGEATAVFFDEVPTYHLVPAVQYYLGRSLEGLKSNPADAYRAFLEIKKNAEPESMVTDARARLRGK
jgi:tetratricopeptide (TPR) repeat protein